MINEIVTESPVNFTRIIFPFEERTYKLTSIVLRNKSLFIPGRGKGGGRSLDSGVITWGGGFGILEGSHEGGGGAENSI